MTPEELRWRAAAWDPEKVQRNQKQQYILLVVWSVFTVAWTSAIAFGADLFSWWYVFVIACGYFSCIVSIVSIINNKRILAGKRSWGDF